MKDIKLITPLEITKEIESIFKDQLFLDKIKNAKTIEEKENIHNIIPTILLYDYIINGKKNRENIIIKYKNETILDFYKKNLIPNFVSINNIKIDNMLSYIETNYLNYSSNRFYTHSFSGALFNDINEYGLDIEKEKFKKEYEILNEIIPNKENKLSYNDLSPYSFINAYTSPIRLTSMIPYELELNKSLYDSLEESLINKIMELNISNSDLYLSTSARILKYYFKQNKICIAVFRKEKTIKNNSSYIRKIFIEKISSYKDYLKKNIKINKKEYDRVRYIDECTKTINEKLKMYEELFNDIYLNRIDLRNSIENHFNTIISDIIVNYCMLNNIKNYTTNEVIPRSNIAIARINNLFN